MTSYFTICANNYLARALVLGDTLKTNDPGSDFYIILADKPAPSVDYSSLNHSILFMDQVEENPGYLWSRYNTVELSTSIKPTAFQYFFREKKADTIVFLDPDIAVYRGFEEVYALLEEADIVLTPHILQPIPYDGLTPWETPFHKVGIFNLGFLALKRSAGTEALLEWWKDRTYRFGYNRQEEGLFTDQIFINHVPVFFDKVRILKHPGYNMAPWNLQERYLAEEGGRYQVTLRDKKFPLVFFHFSTHSFGKIELPFNKYDRFKMKDRPDLYTLYKEYDDRIGLREEAKFSLLKPEYDSYRLYQKARREKFEYKRKNPGKKLFWKILSMLPEQFKKKAIYFLSKDLKG